MSTLSELLPSGGAGGGVLEATASGALSNGDLVVVNSDGTVSVVADTSVSQSIGTPEVFQSTITYYTSATYDSNAQKVVIAYRYLDGSNYGAAVVGTVSGTSISFGTPVVFNSAASNYPSATYDSNTQKVVIAYTDVGNSDYGTAVVGTVSGTSISFGTPVVFESGITGFTSATYDTNAQKIVIAYRDQSNSYYGTAVVGTVSGTSISFGTPVVFNSAQADPVSATYDANAQKVVIAYRDNSNSTYGTAVVGTVSGTSISFGTPVVFESARSEYISATYDSNAQKVVIAYQDNSNSGYGTAIVGTVSGTSISFGTPVVFSNAISPYISATYDANAQEVVIAYQDNGNSFYGTATVFQNAYTSINLTAENYIGIADADYSDTATATIQVAGSVDDAQTGLTAGQAYYVQTDGTLSTTPDNPEVFAGTAVSSTKIIVGG